jgi:hypothetical protein
MSDRKQCLIPFTDEEWHLWENGEEEYIVPLIKKYLCTPEQKEELNAADITIEDCLNARIEGGIPGWVNAMFGDWNWKLGYPYFGF